MSIPELFYEFHGVVECSPAFEALLCQRLHECGKPAEDLTLSEAKRIILAAQGDYQEAAEAEQTEWPRICLDAKAAA